MAIIQMTGKVADLYRSYLQSYRQMTGKEPTAKERAEAFKCATSGDTWNRPHWITG